jgi:hypothetical protein
MRMYVKQDAPHIVDVVMMNIVISLIHILERVCLIVGMEFVTIERQKKLVLRIALQLIIAMKILAVNLDILTLLLVVGRHLLAIYILILPVQDILVILDAMNAGVTAHIALMQIGAI